MSVTTYRRTHSARAFVISAIALGLGCGGLDYGDTTRQLGRTEFVIVPTIHRLHTDTSFDYPLETLVTLLARTSPDLVAVQAPPGLLHDLNAPFYDALPGVRAAIQWARSEEIPVVGVSAFPIRQRPIPAAETNGARWARRTFERQHGFNQDDGIEWLASNEFSRLRAWLDRTGAEPSPIPWVRHAEALAGCLYEHAGKRIALVFDANQAWRMSEAAQPFAVELDVRAFLR